MSVASIQCRSLPAEGSEIRLQRYTNGALRAVITTERLLLRSVTSADTSAYVALYGDAEVMAKYGDGRPVSAETITNRVQNTWVRRWEQGIPFSAFAILEKGTDQFIGHIVVGFGDAPGQGALAYLIHKTYWNRKIGSEAADAIVRHFMSFIFEQRYSIENAVFRTLEATARLDNPASRAILCKVGLRRVRQEERYGAEREVFTATVFSRPVNLIAAYADIEDDTAKEAIERCIP